MIEVLPVVNCMDFACVKQKFDAVQQLECEWVHIDVADGVFAPVTSWNTPRELAALLVSLGPLAPKLEVHLMVNRISDYLATWQGVGVKRFIVHLEALEKLSPEEREKILFSYNSDYTVGLSILPRTPAELLLPYISEVPHGKRFTSVHFVQVLAVSPGLSAQPFQYSVLKKIKFLRDKVADLSIEVDGGITPDVAREAKNAGANIFASASYVWGSPEPRVALEILRTI